MGQTNGINLETKMSIVTCISGNTGISRNLPAMTASSKRIIQLFKQFAPFLAVSFLQAWLLCPKCNSVRSYTMMISFTFLMWVMLWEGNGRLTNWLTTKISWIEFPVKRFFVGVVSTVGFTVVSMVLIMFIFENAFGMSFGRGYIYTIYGSIVVTILISLFLHGRAFLMYWRQATLDKEKFEKESIAARYEALKSQVNPHFLFNSLNALTNLVHENPDKAVTFIKQLSDVYRYVLDTRDQEVVPIDEELKFLNSYLYLQQIRFGQKLTIDNRVHDQSFFTTPLALQLLIENAIKHNVIAEDEPLTIRLFERDGFVCVSNNLQRKKILTEHSAGIGLENIRKRFSLLSDQQVKITDGPDVFEVCLPKLKNR